MISFPNAKINIGLNILEKRADSYHNLQSIFYPINLFDSLEFVISNKTKLHVEGIDLLASDSDNIVIRAHKILQKDYPQIPELDIYLLKKIPIGAGLGGGSADGAFMLMMLNKYFQLEIPKNKLLDYALQLGSDCPFFIINTPCLAKGRGEVLSTLDFSLKDYSIIIAKPIEHIITAWAFSQIEPKESNVDLLNLISTPIERWKSTIINDFEHSMFKAHPGLKSLKEELYALGAHYVSMSGSGSAFYGIFPKNYRENISIKSCQYVDTFVLET